MNWSIVRIVTIVVALTGVAAGFVVNVDRATRNGRDLGLVLTNYFSLFTVVSSVLTIAVLTAAVVWNRAHPGALREPRSIALGLAVVTGPVLLLGLVFNVLLRGEPTADALADAPPIHACDVWATESLHVVLPLLLLLDVLFAPRRRALPWRALFAIVAYPLAWLAYTLVRGGLTPDPAGSSSTWYPYGFLDPTGAGGWPSVIAYVAVMLAVLVGLGAGVIAIGRLRARRAEPSVQPVAPVSSDARGKSLSV